MVLLEGTLAFLSSGVRRTIEKYGEKFPSSAFVEKSEGVVLFVDISGFTDLGKKYRKELDDELTATDALSHDIMSALALLTEICLSWGGDVAKFAGDALLCIWKVERSLRLEDALGYARRAAYEMMIAVKDGDANLDLHGGIGSGSLLQFHLGEEALRWHLVSGSAMLQATTLANRSPKGVILYSNHRAESFDEDIDSVVASRLKSLTEKSVAHRITTNTVINKNAEFAQNYIKDEPKLPRHSTLMHNNGLLEETVLSYIPTKLRQRLQHGNVESGEIMSSISTMFVSLDSLTLTPKELATNKINKEKFSQLNNSFIMMTRIVESYRGQVRDLLFDDKGCVFIAVFGVHTGEEMSELRCVRAAKEISNCLSQSRIGISVGPSFSGLCGTPDRHVFVVMGNDVNMAARFMGGAKSGQILVSPAVCEATKPFMEYKAHSFKRKEENFDCFVLVEELSRSGTFIANYRSYTTKSHPYQFVGRAKEYSQLKKLTQSEHKRITVVSGQEGVGKSALVEALRNRESDCFISYFATAFVLEEHSTYFVAQQLLARFLGIYDSKDTTTTKSPRAKRTAYRVAKPRKNALLQRLKDLDINYNQHILRYLLPSVSSVVNGNDNRSGLRRRSVDYRIREAMENTTTSNISNEAQITIKNFFCELIQKRKNVDMDCMIVIEDLQWIDVASFNLLINLAKEELSGVRFIFLTRQLRKGVSREYKRQEMIESIVKDLVSMKTSSHLSLANLNKQDSIKLIEEIVNNGRDENIKVETELVNSIHKRTKGNPTYIVLLMEWMCNKNLLVNTDGTFCFSDKASISRHDAVCHMPATLVQNTRFRVDNLPGKAYRLLKIAAVIGSRFSQRLLEKVWELDGNDNIDSVNDDLVTLQEHGLIIPVFDIGKKTSIFATNVTPLLKSKMARLLMDNDIWEFEAGIYRDVVLKCLPQKRLFHLTRMIEEARLELNCIKKQL